MNSKKAKRLRQLVRHLQDKGAVEAKDWTQYADEPTMSLNQNNPNNPINMAVKRKLDPECGKSIYKMMKKNA